MGVSVLVCVVLSAYRFVTASLSLSLFLSLSFSLSLSLSLSRSLARSLSLSFQSRTSDSMKGFVRPSVCHSVGLFIGPRWLNWQEWKLLNEAVAFVYVRGVEGGCAPLPTRSRRYCNPAFFVPFLFLFLFLSLLLFLCFLFFFFLYWPAVQTPFSCFGLPDCLSVPFSFFWSSCHSVCLSVYVTVI